MKRIVLAAVLAAGCNGAGEPKDDLGEPSEGCLSDCERVWGTPLDCVRDFYSEDFGRTVVLGSSEPVSDEEVKTWAADACMDICRPENPPYVWAGDFFAAARECGVGAHVCAAGGSFDDCVAASNWVALPCDEFSSPERCR